MPEISTLLTGHYATVLTMLTVGNSFLSLKQKDYFISYTRGKGRPDLVFGNMAALAYHTHLQLGLNNGSDHIPIIIKISTSTILNKERRSSWYKTIGLGIV